jgi:hypothetical protein
MFPIKLNDHLYVNPDAIVLFEFTPNTNSDKAFLTLIFENTELSHLYLRGDEAVEAFANWKAAHASQDRADRKQGGGGSE